MASSSRDTMSVDFKAEIVINTSNSLQKEKSFLEQKLTALRRKRTDGERVLDALKTKLSQTKEVNCKMNATLQVAENKVIESQRQLNYLQQSMEQSSKVVKSLKSDIAKLEEERANQNGCFQQKLDQLAERFIEIRTDFEDARLSQRAEDTLLEITNIKRISCEYRTEKKDMAISLENLRLDTGNNN